MYLDHWHLGTKPFEPTADRGAYYPCESHEGALLKLRYAIENRRGAVVLAGPSGVGKTLLVHLLRDELGESCRPLVHVVFPQMSSRDLLVYIAELIAAPAADPPRHTIEESVRRLEFQLVENAAAGRHTVLVVDEAHLLEDCGSLETLRLLMNIDASGQPTMTLLLVGQPGLLSAVSRLPSLEERMAVKTLLRPLSADETAAYVQHRLAAAGATHQVFTADAVEALHWLSRGVPRQINRLADLALVVGYAQGLSLLAAEHVEEVSEELVSVAAD